MEKALEKRRNSKHGMKRTRLYNIWSNIIMRCTNKNNDCYERYGGRGILICSEWRNEFLSFYKWSIENGYAENLEIDRINVNGNYEPNNCRWTNENVQARNTRVLRKDNLSGFIGVGFNRNANKYQAHITIHGKQKHIWLFKTAKEGAYAYDKYVIDNNLEHTTNGIYTNDTQ